MGSARRQQAKRNRRSRRSIPRSYFKAQAAWHEPMQKSSALSRKSTKNTRSERQEKRDRGLQSDMDDKHETQKNLSAQKSIATVRK